MKHEVQENFLVVLIVATRINLLKAKLKQHFPTTILSTKTVTITETVSENEMYCLARNGPH